MTSKKHTPSGAQRSTSARTTNGPATPNRPERTAASDKKVKTTAAGNEQVTPERLRDFLAHPDVPDAAKRRAEKHVGELYEAGQWDTLPDTPEMFMLEFQQTHINDHLERGTAEPAEREIYGRLAAVINRHEPKDERLVRRLSNILANPRLDVSHDGILTAINDLHNETYTNDLHPEIFPTLARVVIREGRKQAKGRTHTAGVLRRALRELEEIAKGGVR